MSPIYLLYDTICIFCKATPRSKNMTQGQQIINSGLIVDCGATFKSKDRIDLFALILQTSGLSQPPHEVRGMLTLTFFKNPEGLEDYNIEINRMDCSCAGGNSHDCKHIVAASLFCNR